MYFWENLNRLREFHALSMDQLCVEINQESGAKINQPLYLTKAKFNYYLKKSPASEPLEGLLALVNILYCSGRGLNKDRYNILDHICTEDELTFLSTDGMCEEAVSDTVKTFWDNYAFIEESYENVLGRGPQWPSATQYFYKVLSARKSLPPLAVIRDISDFCNIKPYPILYLSPLWGTLKVNVLSRINAKAGLSAILKPDYSSEHRDARDITFELFKKCDSMIKDLEKLKTELSYNLIQYDTRKALLEIVNDMLAVEVPYGRRNEDFKTLCSRAAQESAEKAECERNDTSK